PGCNYGAKNTLDLTYLKRAESVFGAKVITQREADRIERLPDGRWRVETRDPVTGEEHVYFAKVLGLGAGIGSPEILLRNRDVHGTLTLLSDQLGQRYTTNGNFIGFLIGAN